MSSASKSFLIKDILSETSSQTSSDDESNETKEIFLTKPIDLRRYFKHPLCPIPVHPGAFLRTKMSNNHHYRHGHETGNSPLNALFEMTKKTFDKSEISKHHQSNIRVFLFLVKIR